MLDYKIENSDLWYKIFKKKDGVKEYYDVNWQWNKNKTRAKLFFHRADAESALVVIRTKWRKGTEETSSTLEEKVEKQSWSEF